MALNKQNSIKLLVIFALIAVVVLILKLNCPEWINAQPSHGPLSKEVPLSQEIFKEIKEIVRDLYIGIFCPKTMIAT